MDWLRLTIALSFCLVLALLAIALVMHRKGGLRLRKPARRLQLRETLVLDARTALHWVETDGTPLLVVSSSGTVNVRALSVPDQEEHTS